MTTTESIDGSVARERFAELFRQHIHFKYNPYHPLVWILGNPEIGEGTSIGGISEINAIGANIRIGRQCDIGSFVAINVADSHMRAIGIKDSIEARDIYIGDNVFIGSHVVVLGGSEIGHHSVIAAGTTVRGEKVPPYSLVVGNPAIVKSAYYEKRVKTSRMTKA